MREKISPEMNKDVPILGAVVYTSQKGTNEIYESFYNGESCYCILHKSTGYKALFTHDEVILKSIKNKIDRCGALACNTKKNGYGAFTFHPKKKESKIALSEYLFAKYNGVSLQKIHGHKIRRLNESLQEQRIADLRKCNLYDAGGHNSITKKLDVKVIANPENESQKCLAVILTETGMVLEIYNYSRELHHILTHSNLCSLSINHSTGRVSACIHYGRGKDGYRITNLSRLVLAFYTEYQRYQRRRGGIKQFIRDYQSITEANHMGQDASHVNTRKWNGDQSNLIWMNSKSNVSMTDIAGNFYMDYEFFPVAYENGIILAEFQTHDVKHFYKYKSPEDYLDFQKVLMGKCKLTAELHANHFTKDGMEVIQTPRDTHKNLGSPKRQCDDALSQYWAWCKRRDRIVSMYESSMEMFKEWKCLSAGISIGNTGSIFELVSLFMAM